MNFDNRMIRHEMVPPDQLLANPLNYRIHSKVQKDAMKSMLRTLGWIDEIVVNARTGVVINGHMRVDIALSEDEPFVPVRYVDLSEEEENVALATYDNIAALAGIDRDQLDSLLQETQTDDADLSDFLTSLQPAKMPEYEQPLPDSGYENQDLGDQKWLIIVTCESEWQQSDLLQELEERSIECRALSSG